MTVPRSMGKAAQLLNAIQPAVSRSLSELEHTVRVHLFDRRHQAIEPTTYGRAPLDCAPAFLMTWVRGILSFSAIGRSARPGSEAMKPLLPGCSRPCLNGFARSITELANKPWSLPSPDTLSAGPPVAHATRVGRLQAEL